MFIKQPSLQLLLGFVFCFLLCNFARAEEKPEQELESVLKKWAEAAAKVESIDASIQQWSYDDIWRSVKVSKGRIYFEKSGNCSIRTDALTDKETQKSYEKDGFIFTESAPRHWVWYDNKCSIIDHEKERVTSYGLERAESAHREAERIRKEGTFWKKLTCFNIGFIVHSPKNHLLPILLESDITALKQRFEFKNYTKHKTEQIYLTAIPKLENNKMNFDRIDILIDAETNRPSAIQVYSHGGRERFISELQNVRINQKPKDRDELLQPKLEGYRCYEEK